MQMTRDEKGLNIKSSPIRVNIDTYEARNSIVPTIPRKLEQDAQAGQQAAYEATASYAQQGQLLLKARARRLKFKLNRNRCDLKQLLHTYPS